MVICNWLRVWPWLSGSQGQPLHHLIKHQMKYARSIVQKVFFEFVTDDGIKSIS